MTASDRPTLYGYFRSSASYRVRIALNLKGIAYDLIPVNLLQNEQRGEAYAQVNPLGAVPTLGIDGHLLSESLAICEYLEETRPTPPLLPSDPGARAAVRRLCEAVNAGIQPLQNLHVLQRIQTEFAADEAQRKAWAAHFIRRGLLGVEKLLQSTAGIYAFGDSPTLADAFLVPQMYGARRFGVDLTEVPTVQRVTDAAMQLEPVERAAPWNQPDCPPGQR